MRILIILLTLTYYSAKIYAQSSVADSLLTLVKSSPDNQKGRIYDRLAWHYVWSWPDSTIKYAQMGIPYSKQFEQYGLTLTLLHAHSTALAEKGNFPMGLEKAYEALSLATSMDDQNAITNSYSMIGSAYFYAGDYKSALQFYRKIKENPDYYNSLKPLHDGFLGETYFHLNQYDSADLYLNASHNYYASSESHWAVPYLYLGKLSEARGHLQEALEFYKEIKINEVPVADQIKGSLAIANIYEKNENLDSAIHYAGLAYKMSQNTSFLIFSAESAQLLKNAYSRIDIDSAYKYQALLLNHQDNLFSREKLTQLQNITYEQERSQLAIVQERNAFINRTIIFSLISGLILILVVVFILVRSNRFKQRAYNLLQQQKTDLDIQKSKVEVAIGKLKSTQAQLIHSEKMASLGELTAGIAHEIQNPLNFVNNFSEINKELIEELKLAYKNNDQEEIDHLTQDLVANEEKVLYHGKRAEAIVRSMLLHSKGSKGEKEPTDMNLLCDEYLRLAYHGIRAKDKSFNAEFILELDADLPKINVVPQDIGRVVLNLINNAFQAVRHVEKPLVKVVSRRVKDQIEISVIDNGPGIRDEIRDKIFQPFFTTKPTGEGTGLGLSLAYDIVKAHGGEINVVSRTENSASGTTIQVTLPLPGYLNKSKP